MVYHVTIDDVDEVRILRSIWPNSAQWLGNSFPMAFKRAIGGSGKDLKRTTSAAQHLGKGEDPGC
jgi:hypothetical protein